MIKVRKATPRLMLDRIGSDQDSSISGLFRPAEVTFETKTVKIEYDTVAEKKTTNVRIIPSNSESKRACSNRSQSRSIAQSPKPGFEAGPLTADAKQLKLKVQQIPGEAGPKSKGRLRVKCFKLFEEDKELDPSLVHLDKMFQESRGPVV